MLKGQSQTDADSCFLSYSQQSLDAVMQRATALATETKLWGHCRCDLSGRFCWHLFRQYWWMTVLQYASESLPLKAKYLFCFNLFAVWWVDIWQFRAFEKSTYFFTVDNLVSFFSSSGVWIVLMWKKHPSGTWSRLKLTLYVICKENCNHRGIVFVATANPP